MAKEPSRDVIKRIIKYMSLGKEIEVKKIGDTKILRIEWLNLYNEPEVLNAIGGLIAFWIKTLGYKPDAITSVETSGAKYGISASLHLSIPYFSLHKIDKVIFNDPVYVESRSITESRALKLYADRSIVNKFNNVVLVDDIRRTSSTIDSAVELVEKCGSKVCSCFVVLDFKFAGHPYPKKIRKDRFHSLFVISKVSDNGKCEVKNGLALEYIKKDGRKLIRDEG